MSDDAPLDPVLDRDGLLRLAARTGLRLDDEARLSELAADLSGVIAWAAELPPCPQGCETPDPRDALDDRRRPDVPAAADAAARVAAALRADLPAADDAGRVRTGPTRQED